MAAVTSIPLILAAGVAVDYTRYLSATKHLQEVADAGALAVAAATEKDEEKLRKRADEVVQGNYSDSRIDTLQVASLELKDDQVDLRVKGSLPTVFMGLVGIDKMDVGASALAVRAVRGSVEVALVLDNTESMNYDNKIGTLKTAASNLVKELYGNEDADVRIALVPYAEQINIGTSYRNASWLSVPDDYTKITTTEGRWSQPQKNGACLDSRPGGTRQVERDGIWITESYNAYCAKYERIDVGEPVWIPEKTTTTTYRWYGCIGARVNNKKLVLDDGSPNLRYPGYVATSHKCLTEVVPLTGTENTIQSAITGMITSRSGYVPNTYIPNGMMWGINVLSKSEPFSEGLEYDAANETPRKVIVLMTDGLNTRRINLTGTLNLDYLKGGALIGDTNSADTTQRLQTNKDTTALCNYAKTKKIEIFTVAFKVDDTDAKTMLQGCATDAEHYYDASDSEALLAAFSGIARSLSLVRLAR